MKILSTLIARWKISALGRMMLKTKTQPNILRRSSGRTSLTITEGNDRLGERHSRDIHTVQVSVDILHKLRHVVAVLHNGKPKIDAITFAQRIGSYNRI